MAKTHPSRVLDTMLPKRKCPTDLLIATARLHAAAAKWANRRSRTHEGAHYASRAETFAYRASAAAEDGRCTEAKKLAAKAADHLRAIVKNPELQGSARKRRR